ncbi:hypothetical protein JOM56_003099 [Amanita muscaria]
MQPHAFLNPIQRLFPEILAMIFTFCLPDVPKDLGELKHISSRNAPLLLCSVCSSWRCLAISTPHLWQTLHFCSDEKLTINTESITSGIRTWLDRSRALPLSIRVVFWIRDPSPESDEETQRRLIFKVLSQEVSRWEVLEIYENKIWVTHPPFGNLPMLHTLDISESSIDGIPFTAAPRLKKLSLRSLPNPTSVSAIPWDRLVELTIRKAQTISIVVEVIQCCPRLESLYLQVKEGNEDGSLTSSSIPQHDTLRRLHLYLPRPSDMIIDRLTLPALADLSSRYHLSDSEVDLKFRRSQLVAFFTRSNCELQEIALYHPEFGPSELLECLSHRSCQTLTHLVIQGDEPLPPMVDRELLIRLTYSDVDDEVPLCPKLGHFELDNCYSSDSSFPDLLGRMIQSRCFGRAQDAQLRSLRLSSLRFSTRGQSNHHGLSVSSEDYELLQFSQSNGGLNLRYSDVTLGLQL